MTNAAPIDYEKITTLIFDVDDTLYDVGNGFTAHRNSDVSETVYLLASRLDSITVFDPFLIHHDP